MKSTILGLVLVLGFCGKGFADWKEPGDKKITEDQVKTYIATANDWLGQVHEILMRVQASTTPEGKIAALGDMDKKEQDCLDKHHISKAEFEWVGQRVLEAYNVVTVGDQMIAASSANIQEQTRANDQKLADAKKRLAAFEAAGKAGTRVMSDEDRAAAIEAAKADLNGANDDIKQHSDAAADDADGLKALQDAKDRAKVAQARVDHPEVPVTDDEKTAVKADNEAGIAQAQQDIDAGQKVADQLKMVEAEIAKSATEMRNGIPDENIALARKYSDQIKVVVAKVYTSGAATQP